MNIEELRQQPQFVAQLREVMNVDVVRIAIAALKATVEAEDAATGADAIDSVRLLSRRAGRIGMLNDFLSLAEPAPTPERQRIPTFGLDMSQEDAAEALGINPL